MYLIRLIVACYKSVARTFKRKTINTEDFCDLLLSDRWVMENIEVILPLLDLSKSKYPTKRITIHEIAELVGHNVYVSYEDSINVDMWIDRFLRLLENCKIEDWFKTKVVVSGGCLKSYGSVTYGPEETTLGKAHVHMLKLLHPSLREHIDKPVQGYPVDVKVTTVIYSDSDYPRLYKGYDIQYDSRTNFANLIKKSLTNSWDESKFRDIQITLSWKDGDDAIKETISIVSV